MSESESRPTYADVLLDKLREMKESRNNVDDPFLAMFDALDSHLTGGHHQKPTSWMPTGTVFQEEDIPAVRYNRHKNDAGDRCVWSGLPAAADVDEEEQCPQHCERSNTIPLCKVCGEDNNDGEGWNGRCGNCADIAQRKADGEDQG